MLKSKDLLNKNAPLNILQLENWDILIQFCGILKLFYKTTKYLKNNAINSIYRTFTEIGFVLKFMNYMIKQKSFLITLVFNIYWILSH